MPRPDPGQGLLIRCACGSALSYHRKSHSYVCDVLLQMEEEGLLNGGLVGILNPRETALGRVKKRSVEAQLEHVTCLPAEVADQDDAYEVSPDVSFARGQGFGDPTVPQRTNGRRTIVDHRGVPLNEIQRDKLVTYQCDQCGVRTPSPYAAQSHADREGHTLATPRGDEVSPNR